MATNNLPGFTSIESTTTITTALQAPTIRSIEKHFGRLNIIKALSFFITHFNNNFNAKGKLNKNQIVVLAGDLFERFQYETLEDAMLMFKYARQGKIGDGQDWKLDSQNVFHKWMPDYLELKAEEREKQHFKNKNEIKEQSNEAQFHPDVAEKLFKNVGEEKVNLDKSGKGLGARYKKDLVKAEVITNQTDYLNEMFKKVKTITEKQLKNYLIKNDTNSENFDPQVYEMVENEIDLRNKK